MKNFKFIISYDGSRYFGWERQPGRDTIQGKLEAVLTRMCGTDVQVIGAGRTDAGVHARAMAANAYMNTEKTPEEILKNTSVTLMKNGETRTEKFTQQETSVDVRVKLDDSVDKCWLKKMQCKRCARSE